MTLKERILKCKEDNPQWSHVRISKEVGCVHSVVRYHLNPSAKRKKFLSDNKRKRDYKEKLILSLPSQSCIICGYNRCIKALDFHHVDPSSKNIRISAMRAMAIDKIKEEIKKCVLLCANCHREYHAGLIQLPVVES